MIDIQKAKQRFLEFTSEYDLKEDNLKRKELHSLRVMEQAKNIAKKMKLPQEEIDLATLIGLLHDIGRFEQYKRHQTYSDLQTFNHGEFGADYLKENNQIRKYIENNQYDNIIDTAIRNHSKNEIEVGLPEKELLHAKLIRDADKLDIFFEATEIFWLNDIEEMNQTIAEEENLNYIQQEKTIPRTKEYNFRHINAVIELIALVFDLNFKESFEILKEEQYIDRITKRFNSKDKNTKNVLEETRRKINQFIDRKIKAS